MINPKSPDAPPESPRDSATPEAPFFAYAALMHRGVEKLAEMQKISLDLVARHTSDAIAVYKDSFKVPADTPMMSMFDLAQQGFEKMMQTQKGVVDLAVQHSARLLDASKLRTDSASRYTSTTADLLGEAVDTVVGAQKLALDFAAEQNKVVANAIKKQAPVAGSPPAMAAVDTMQRNVDVAIQTQKEMVQAAAKPMKGAAA